MLRDIFEHKDIFLLKILTEYDFSKYSLNIYDFQGERFKNNYKVDKFYDVLSISRPRIVAEQSERFFKSGVDIVGTLTQKANRYFLKNYDLEELAYELNYAAAKIIHDNSNKYSHLTREQPRYTAGIISALPDVLSDEEIQSSVVEQIKAFLAGKVDLFVLYEMKNSKQVDLVLDSLDSVLKKRHRHTDVFIVYSENCEKKEIDNKYENLRVLAVGGYNIDKADCNMLVLRGEREQISVPNNYKVLGFEAGFSSKDIEKFIE